MKVLFVCLGNICRSPLADGILRDLSAKNGLNWEIDSAGTGDWHAGEAPDERAIAVAKKNGVDISKLRARQFKTEDFDHFDRIYVMDGSNYSDLLSQSRGSEDMIKIDWLLNLSSPGENNSVPDPYTDSGMFDEVYAMVNEACEALIQIKE